MINLIKKILAACVPFIILTVCAFSFSVFIMLIGIPVPEVSKAKLIAALFSKKVIIYFFGLWVLWVLYAYIFSYLTQRTFYPALKVHAWSYLPSLLFLVYPLQFKYLHGVNNFYYVPGLDHILIISVIFLVISIKGYLATGFPSPARALITLAILLLLIQQWITGAAYFHNGVDDAYISFRYAQNWATGNGLVFNPGERVEGYTNFFWTILLGLGIKIGFDPLVLAKLLGVFSALGVQLVNAAGDMLNKEYLRADLPKDVSPGEEILMNITLKAPDKPGQYGLKLDLVDELIDWFENRQSTPLMVAIDVL